MKHISRTSNKNRKAKEFIFVYRNYCIYVRIRVSHVRMYGNECLHVYNIIYKKRSQQATGLHCSLRTLPANKKIILFKKMFFFISLLV